MTQANRNNVLSTLLSRTGKKLLTTTAMTAVGLLGATGKARAADDWSDHVQVGGSAGSSISIDTTVSNVTNITQTGHRVKVQGDGDIKAGHTVNVNQDTSRSQYILFDVEDDPTYIRGNLNANGEIYIFDQNGVIFGENSQVDVASIVTSTGHLTSTDLDLDQGKIKIDSIPLGSKIENRGTITVAEGGVAAFVAPTVKNSGVVNAKVGTVAMAAGETVTLDMYGDGLVEVAVDGELADGLIENTGSINANGGNVVITASAAKNAVDNVINMDGVIDVSSATVKGGKIILSGGSKGTVAVKGKLNANGKSGKKAGSVKVTGTNIKVAETATVTADSDTGEAGEVIVFADDTLTVDGITSAQGEQGTGFIETSGKHVNFGLGASILATREWLIDPTDQTINAVFAGLLSTQLDTTGDATVTTVSGGADDGDIAVDAIVSWTSSNTLNLIADRDINFNAGGGVLAVSGGSLVANAGGNIRLHAGNESILARSGDVTLTAADEFTLVDGQVRVAGGDILINNGGAFEALKNSIVNSGAGGIELNQNQFSGLGVVASPTIQNAVDALHNVGSGQNIINVGAGTWGSVVVNQSNLTLNGANAGTTGASGSRVPESIITSDSSGVLVVADNTKIDGFTIEGGSVAGSNGVEMTGRTDLDVVNNIIQNHTHVVPGTYTTGLGVFVTEGMGEINIQNNLIQDNRSGVRLLNTDAANLGDIIIDKNTITGHGDKGIVTTASDMIEITNNNINDNRMGVWLENSSNNVIDDNGIDGSSQNGIYVRNKSNNNTITQNIITSSGTNGVEIAVNSDNNIVDTNLIELSRKNGVRIETGVDNSVVNNFIGGSDMVSEIGEDNVIGSNGVLAKETENLTITGNTIYDHSFKSPGRYETGLGVFVDNSTGQIDISNNTITDNESGVRLRDTDAAVLGDITITDNKISGHGDKGIVLTVSDKIEITDNDLDDNRMGIWLEKSSDGLIDDNVITDSGQNAIFIRNKSNNNTISNNEIADAGQNGILISVDSSESNTHGNEITDIKQDGIRIEGGSSHVVSNNTIMNTGKDGIHVSDNEGEGTIFEDDAFFSLVIRNNDINTTGDDGIEVDGAARTMIRNNLIRQTGTAEGYQRGDFGGADGIHVEGAWAHVADEIEAQAISSGVTPTTGDEYEYGEEPEGNYALIIRNNHISTTADDGIEVVGHLEEPEFEGGFDPRVGNITSGVGEGDHEHHDAVTYRVLLAENLISENGYFSSERPEDLNSELPFNIGEDGYGHDGIHVRNVAGVEKHDDYTAAYALTSGAEPTDEQGGVSFYGYAVDIVNNVISKTGDDGVEVYNSDSTLILGNNISFAGVYEEDLRAGISTTQGPSGLLNTDGADYYGADGIHVRNVGGQYGLYNDNNDWNQNIAAGPVDNNGGIDPYSVAIVDNSIEHTADDGIEVIGEAPFSEGECCFEETQGPQSITAYNPNDGEGYNGTGRTLILANVIRDAGVSGEYGREILTTRDTREGYSYERERSYYGHQGAYDGFGGDGIHVRGVGSANVGEFRPDRITAGASGDTSNSYAGNYGIKILENDILRTGDDGIEVLGSEESFRGFNIAAPESINGFYPRVPFVNRVLIENNIVAENGLSGGSNGSESTEETRYVDGDGYYDVDNEIGFNRYYGNEGGDADGIRVVGIGSGNNDNSPQWIAAGQATGGDETGYYGYAVDVIGNTVTNTGDDGIEVSFSDSTFVYDNDVTNAGILATGMDLYQSLRQENNAYGTEKYYEINNRFFTKSWTGGDGIFEGESYNGGDGISIVEVGIGNDFRNEISTGTVSGGGFFDYAAVVLENRVDSSGDDGIEVLGAGRTRIEQNEVTNSGLAFHGYTDLYSVMTTIFDSVPTETVRHDVESETYNGAYDDSFSAEGGRGSRGSDGIHVSYGYADEFDGTMMDTRQNAVANGSTLNSVEIINNIVDNSGDDGVQVSDSGITMIRDNVISNSGLSDFTSVETDGSGYFTLPSSIISTDDEGTTTTESSLLMSGGTGALDYTCGDGINVDRNDVRRVARKSVPKSVAISAESSPSEFDVKIINNTVTDSADDGIEVVGGFGADDYYNDRPDITMDGGSFNVLIDANDVTNSGDNGIALLSGQPIGNEKDESESSVSFIASGSPMNSLITGNDVLESGDNGLLVGGKDHDQVIVSDNIFTESDIGMNFESGEIDLTGDANTIGGSRVAMRFAPYELDEGEEGFIYADMLLVDNTIGETIFTGQPDEYYVELDNGALFAPGTPTQLSADDATFTGTPFGTFKISQDYPDGLPGDVLSYLENAFYHFNDDGTLGLFFFQPLADIPQERVFGPINPQAVGSNGLNVTLLGLPNVPGFSPNIPALPTAANLNNIAPAAGDDVAAQLNNIAPAAGGEEDTSNPAALNEIEAAAGSGGEQSTCWDDALNTASTGQATTFGFDGSAEDLLNAEAGCKGFQNI